MHKVFLLLLYTFFLSINLYANSETIGILSELKKSHLILNQEIDAKLKLKKKSLEPSEIESLTQEIRLLQNENDNFQNKFDKIASGIDTTLIESQFENSNSTIGNEFQTLLKPLLQLARQATEKMRIKSQLQEERKHYEEILHYATNAKNNVELLLKDANSTVIKDELQILKKYWEKKIEFTKSSLNATLQHMEILEKDDIPLHQSFSKNFTSFFHNQGLILLEALVALIGIIIATKMIHLLLITLFPIFTHPNRTLFIRLLDLFYRIFGFILFIVTPMAIFYYEENWILSSIGILIIIGMAWTFKSVIPQLWQEGRLLLNIGSVRQEERISYQNLPWRVKNINIFTIIENPDSGVSLRIPIEELVGLISRPVRPKEPWFPCRLNDWVLLSNDYYGKVVGISLEFIELVDTGGGHKTFIVSDFLSLSPLNHSTGFRVIHRLGISYRHQKESTDTILILLEEYIKQQFQNEKYSEHLKTLVVQFSDAGDSSLQLVIIASFDGELASIYFRLRRAIARWSVDACSHYDWEIPFPQLTINHASENIETTQHKGEI